MLLTPSAATPQAQVMLTGAILMATCVPSYVNLNPPTYTVAAHLALYVQRNSCISMRGDAERAKVYGDRARQSSQTKCGFPTRRMRTAHSSRTAEATRSLELGQMPRQDHAGQGLEYAPLGQRRWGNSSIENLKALLEQYQVEKVFGQHAITLSCLFGVILGLTLPADFLLPPPWNRVSSVLGWTYFSAWSLSFYPQLYLNWKRQSVVGLSLDFVLFNFLGFVCYAVYNCCMFWSPIAREQYRATHNGQDSSVQVNDVVFGIHAVLLVAATGLQAFLFDRGGQALSIPSVTITAAVSTGCLVAGLLVLEHLPDSIAVPSADSPAAALPWYSLLNWLYLLSGVKLVITLFKYTPQLLLNHRRRSTVGWNIWNVLLDLMGGLLSLLQQVLDAVITADWSALTGNPIKMLLAFITIGFDTAFIVQHYIMYPEAQDSSTSSRIEGEYIKIATEADDMEWQHAPVGDYGTGSDAEQDAGGKVGAEVQQKAMDGQQDKRPATAELAQDER